VSFLDFDRDPLNEIDSLENKKGRKFLAYGLFI